MPTALLLLAAAVAALVYAINLGLMPMANTKLKDQVMEIRTDLAASLLKEGAFSNPIQGLTVYIRERESNGDMRGILVHDNRELSNPVTYMAERGALVGEINALAPKQGTPLADAIRRAGTVASDSAPSMLVIVSDGGDSCGGDPCAVARSVKAAKPNVTINVIDLSESPKDRQVLQCIASAGGGRLLSPGDPLDMNRKMREAAGAANCP